MSAHGPGLRRFIPACAGNSRPRGPQRRPPTVHPRVCGELLDAHPQIVGADGSSPRVRGTRLALGDQHGGARFIPACAGNSPSIAPAIDARTVHPRVCGELTGSAPLTSWPSGSSPRVRGTLGRRARVQPRRRFIPACAGNSTPPPKRFGAAAVHPRVCGELPIRRFLPPLGVGSSPRVRGTLPRVAVLDHDQRFIPACAGNSGGKPWRSPRRTVHPRVCGELHKRAA